MIISKCTSNISNNTSKSTSKTNQIRLGGPSGAWEGSATVIVGPATKGSTATLAIRCRGWPQRPYTLERATLGGGKQSPYLFPKVVPPGWLPPY